MFDGTFGVANDLMVRLGLLGQYVPWLSDPGGSLAVLVAAMVWSGQPLMVIILLAVLQTIPRELYEATRAGRWTSTRPTRSR
jgi:multiple sugar transport system permease protein